MCGRFALTASPDRVAELLALAGIAPFPPRYNIAPTQPILIAIGGGPQRPGANLPDRTALLVRWGLIPAWVKDPRDFPLLINARAETAATKNAFRGALRYRRCLIPVSGFYEWQRQGSGKGARKGQAYFVRAADGEPFALAGLMETYLAPDGSEIDTAAILTRAANAALGAIHDRMPVPVGTADHARWLDCRTYDPEGVADILEAANDDFFEPVRISDKVNKVANTGPDIQAPLVGGDAAVLTGTPAGRSSGQDRRKPGPRDDDDRQPTFL